MSLVSEDKERWTEEGVRTLASASPGDVRDTEDGKLVPLATPREVWGRMQRYPTLFGRPSEAGRSDADPALRARFPSMFPKG